MLRVRPVNSHAKKFRNFLVAFISSRSLPLWPERNLDEHRLFGRPLCPMKLMLATVRPHVKTLVAANRRHGGFGSCSNALVIVDTL